MVVNMEQETLQRNGSAEQHEVAGCARMGGVMSTPCGTTECVSLDIDPEEFLTESCAPVCWDCWYVWRKIKM